jgi:coenzyme Q-binding protein COQ10
LPTFETTRRVPFTAEQMFAVVADVERYPQFVPLCEQLIVRERAQNGADTILTATMSVGYRAIRETFTSRVTLMPAQREIDVTKIDGPFARLTNHWRFRDVPGGSEVHFHIDYAFASRTLSLLMGAVFDKAVRKYTEAFETRARALYGAVPSDTIATQDR